MGRDGVTPKILRGDQIAGLASNSKLVRGYMCNGFAARMFFEGTGCLYSCLAKAFRLLSHKRKMIRVVVRRYWSELVADEAVHFLMAAFLPSCGGSKTSYPLCRSRPLAGKGGSASTESQRSSPNFFQTAAASGWVM